jgi:hypothetical protein
MATVTTTFAAKDESFSSTTQRLQKSLAGFESSLDRFNASAANIGTSFAKLGAGLVAGVAAFVGVRSAAEGVKKAFDEAGQSQQFERRFETLLGSADAARKRMEGLERFMDKTPFQLPGIVQASQTLEALTNGALSTGKGLQMVGDTASATGQPIDEMAVTIGRLYNGLSEGGTAVGYQTKRLVDLGVITPQVAQRLNDLAKEGVGSARAFEIIQAATSKFSGEMQRQSTTWNATLEGLGDAINKALRNFATPLIELLTPQIQKVADFVRNTLAPAIEAAMSKFTSDWLPGFLNAAQTATDYLRGALSLTPSEMFELMISNMLDFQRIAADTLIGAFATAVSGLGNLMREFFVNYVPELIGETLGQAFVYATTTLSSALFKVFVDVVEYFGTLWQSATQMSAKELLGKLMEVVQSFATGWGRAMIDPVGFIAQKVGKGLTDAFVDSAHEFLFQFDTATGSWIEKTDKALENTSLAAGRKLGEAGGKLGDALLKSMEQAIRDTHKIEVNLFGSEEAARRMEKRFAKMAEHGRRIREEAEAAATGSQGEATPSPPPTNEPPPPPPPPPPPRGGFSSPAPTMSNLDRLREAAKTDPSARAALMRLQAEQSQGMARAGDMRASGQFGAAARAEIRAERRAGQRADRAAALESATDMFGGSSMGEAFENYRRQMQGSGEKAISEADFRKWAGDQVKTEKEREREAERGTGPGGKKDEPANPLTEIASKIDKIIDEITERLPQNALA